MAFRLASLRGLAEPLRARASFMAGRVGGLAAPTVTAGAPRVALGEAVIAAARSPALWKLETRTLVTAVQVTRPAQTRSSSPAPPAAGGVRAMSTWRLRPYAAAAGASAVVPMSSLSAGFSKVGLSLLVMPWKALPMALALAPVAWVLPAAYRMIFQNSVRHTTASIFTVVLYLVLSFMPVPCFENLFSELSFYGIALASTFFMYTLFPELMLHDFMFMHYMALFTVPLIPLAFAYMPMFAARSYLFL